MATGKRIRFFRTKIGLTQKQLGEKLGFTGRTSDVRMAQYESEARSPKQDLINQLAQIFMWIHVPLPCLILTPMSADAYPFCPGRYVRLEDQRY